MQYCGHEIGFYEQISPVLSAKKFLMSEKHTDYDNTTR